MKKPQELIGLFLPSPRNTLFILLFLGVLISGPKMLNIDGDLPRHLLMGKYVIEIGTPPTQEIFSYPYEGEPYVSHEWLAGVIYYLSYILFGLNGVVILAGILIATTFTVLYSQAVAQHGERFLNFILVILGAAVTSIHWISRPHLFTMLFLAMWLIWMNRLSRGEPMKLWAFPALMLLWGNIHAEFVAGFLVLLAYIVGWFWQYLFAPERINMQVGRNLLLVTGASFLASLINPAGLKTWEIVLGYVNNSYLMSRITETRPPDFAKAEYLPLLILIVFAILLMIFRRSKFIPAHTFLMLGFGMMSLYSARNAHLFGVVAPFVLSYGLSGMTNFQAFKNIEAMVTRVESQTSGKMLPIVITVILSFVVLARAGNFNRFDPNIFPVEAVSWLKNNPQSGRMFNAFDWGGYILFHLWPEQKAFIESQTDVRGKLTREYEAVVTLSIDWQGIFRKYDISLVIIPPQWDLARELKVIGWKTVYQDTTAIILVRK
jgi:hypothetical protein